MIKIEIFRNATESIEEFQVNGHADAGAYGEDVVCAAVSALTQTALLGLGKYLGRELDYRVASADLHMRLKTLPDASTNAILETMLLGLREIATINPKSVQILEHRR